MAEIFLVAGSEDIGRGIELSGSDIDDGGSNLRREGVLGLEKESDAAT